MRSRKRIALLDVREDRRGVMSFVLETTRRYRVVQLTHPTEGAALDCLGIVGIALASVQLAHPSEGGALENIDLLIAVWPVAAAPTMVLRQVLGCPLLFINHSSDKIPRGLVPNEALLGLQVTPENVLLSVHTLSARKRGPRKGVYRNRK